jgi:hypothetical protein
MNQRIRSRRFRPALGLALSMLTVAVLLLGCSADSTRKDHGILSGQVIYQGKPLTGGTIRFFQAGRPPAIFAIWADGSYSAELPVGPARVAFETESVKYKSREMMLKRWEEHWQENPDNVDISKVPKKDKKFNLGSSSATFVYVEIPAPYKEPDTSGVTHEVVEGDQDRDFDLK